MSWRAAAGLRFPEATDEVIASIGEHRVLSTAQVRAIHFSDRSARRSQQVLAYLERAGLIAYVEARRAPRRLWFLTERGANLALDAGGERRLKVLAPEQAAGPLRAHTLAVNEVGISFLRAARERGDEFGPLSWRHEVAHPLNRGRGRARRMLIADAVLSYVRADDWHLIYGGGLRRVYGGGLRRGELQALRAEDVDLANGVIRVEFGWEYREGQIPLKSDAGRRKVPISAPSFEISSTRGSPPAATAAVTDSLALQGATARSIPRS